MHFAAVRVEDTGGYPAFLHPLAPLPIECRNLACSTIRTSTRACSAVLRTGGLIQVEIATLHRVPAKTVRFQFGLLELRTVATKAVALGLFPDSCTREALPCAGIATPCIFWCIFVPCLAMIPICGIKSETVRRVLRQVVFGCQWNDMIRASTNSASAEYGFFNLMMNLQCIVDGSIRDLVSESVNREQSLAERRRAF